MSQNEKELTLEECKQALDLARAAKERAETEYAEAQAAYDRANELDRQGKHYALTVGIIQAPMYANRSLKRAERIYAETLARYKAAQKL